MTMHKIGDVHMALKGRIYKIIFQMPLDNKVIVCDTEGKRKLVQYQWLESFPKVSTFVYGRKFKNIYEDIKYENSNEKRHR